MKLAGSEDRWSSSGHPSRFLIQRPQRYGHHNVASVVSCQPKHVGGSWPVPALHSATAPGSDAAQVKKTKPAATAAGAFQLQKFVVLRSRRRGFPGFLPSAHELHRTQPRAEQQERRRKWGRGGRIRHLGSQGFSYGATRIGPDRQ